MKKRERRRYLTQKYQQRQVRLANLFRQYTPYDPYRYLQRPLAIRQRFYDELCGRFVGPDWGIHERDWKTRLMISGGYDIDPLTDAQLGRFRNHSFRDCGRPRCPSCGNPRRARGWISAKERITVQERISEEAFNEELDLLRKGEYDEEVYKRSEI